MTPWYQYLLLIEVRSSCTSCVVHLNVAPATRTLVFLLLRFAELLLSTGTSIPEKTADKYTVRHIGLLGYYSDAIVFSPAERCVPAAAHERGYAGNTFWNGCAGFLRTGVENWLWCRTGVSSLEMRRCNVDNRYLKNDTNKNMRQNSFERSCPHPLCSSCRVIPAACRIVLGYP